jgi:hypothetical protein
VPQKVEKASIAGSDLVYIDEFWMTHTVSAVSRNNNENILQLPRLVDLHSRAKLVSVGFSHGFVVTEDNEVFVWILQAKEDNIMNKH